MKYQLIAAVLSFEIGCHAIPAPAAHAPHEKRLVIPRLWQRESRIESDAILPVRIGLTQKNLDNGYEYLMDV